MPGPKIHSCLKGFEAVEGEDAHFSIELSTAMAGTWFLNSAQLTHGGRFSIEQSETKHSLVIHETGITEDMAEVTFIANGVRDSAVLKVKRRCQTLLILFTLACNQTTSLEVIYFVAAAVVKFSPLSEVDSEKRVDTGDAIVLYCEVSHASAQVSWFKDGKELHMTDGLNIQAEGNMRRIVIQSADAAHSGIYTCEMSGDVIQFNVDVAGKEFLKR